MTFDPIPQWAIDKAETLAGAETSSSYLGVSHMAFARYIAAHEEAPVDPLLIEAREMAAVDAYNWPLAGVRTDDGTIYYGANASAKIRAGKADRNVCVTGRLAAIRRGMELAQLTNQDGHHD